MNKQLLESQLQVHKLARNGVHGLDRRIMKFISDHVLAGWKTLETGLGLSTLAFISCRSQHTCITPSADEIEKLKIYCDHNAIDLQLTTFITDFSENALPLLKLNELDMVLIDGRHGFPAPMLDWYYMARMLRVGGFAIIDDTHIWAVKVLIDFLKADPRWRLVLETPRACIFKKIGQGSESAEWDDQGYVVSRSRSYILRKRFRTLAESLRYEGVLATWQKLKMLRKK